MGNPYWEWLGQLALLGIFVAALFGVGYWRAAKDPPRVRFATRLGCVLAMAGYAVGGLAGIALLGFAPFNPRQVATFSAMTEWFFGFVFGLWLSRPYRTLIEPQEDS